MAMPKVFNVILERLDRLERIEKKLDELIAMQQPAATAKTMPKGEAVVQVDEATADKMQKAGDFAPTSKPSSAATSKPATKK